MPPESFEQGTSAAQPPSVSTLERQAEHQSRHRRAVIEQRRRVHIRKQAAAAAQRRAADLEREGKPA